MTLDLTDQHGTMSDDIADVTERSELDEWTDVCSQAFGYQIDVNSLTHYLMIKMLFYLRIS